MRTSITRFAVFALSLLALAACKEDQKAHQPPTPQSFSLPVVKVGVEKIPRLYTIPGGVKSDERIEVSSRISGYIQKLTVHEGDTIKKGTLLFEIDPTDVEGAIRRAQAATKAATTSLSDAENDVGRLSRLKKKGAVSNESVRKARVTRDVARSSLAEAQAALDTALAGRRYTSVKSPINGIVVARNKQVGDLATPGVPILTIESRTSLLFKTSVAESRVRHIHRGDKVRIEIDALHKTKIKGVVLRVIPSGDPVTRRYDVEVSLPKKLKAYPGMFGRVHFVIGSEKSPVVTRKAIVERGGLRGVFVVGKDNKARFRWLRTGRELSASDGSGRIEVKAGLAGGETILAYDDRRVHDGDLIKQPEKAASDE